MGATMKRKFLACLVALGLAPGTFVRSEFPPPEYTSLVTVTKLGAQQASSGPLKLEDAWVLESDNYHFGGYSALAYLGDGQFVAASDRGRLLEFAMPDSGETVPQITQFPRYLKDRGKTADIEAMVHDSRTGRSWIAVETRNRIRRFTPGRASHSHIPEDLAEWPSNEGPESMARLEDGRFLLIAEANADDTTHEALLFDGDPVERAPSDRFFIEGAEGYHPSDATLLPDGRIVVLLRKVSLGLPYRFRAKLAVFDPSAIRPGAHIAMESLATIDRPFPTDNYEGLAVTEDGEDWIVWLISDDNFSPFQRTLLLKLRWIRQKARK